MTDWISVEERLPQYSGRYIVAYDSGDVDICWWNNKYKEFDRGYLTHWIPLPEPPAGEEK